MPEVLNYFTLFRSFLSILSVSRNLSFRKPKYSALQSYHTRLRFGSLSPDDSHTSALYLLLLDRAYIFWKFLLHLSFYLTHTVTTQGSTFR